MQFAHSSARLGHASDLPVIHRSRRPQALARTFHRHLFRASGADGCRKPAHCSAPWVRAPGRAGKTGDIGRIDRDLRVAHGRS